MFLNRDPLNGKFFILFVRNWNVSRIEMIWSCWSEKWGKKTSNFHDFFVFRHFSIEISINVQFSFSSLNYIPVKIWAAFCRVIAHLNFCYIYFTDQLHRLIKLFVVWLRVSGGLSICDFHVEKGPSVWRNEDVECQIVVSAIKIDGFKYFECMWTAKGQEIIFVKMMNG